MQDFMQQESFCRELCCLEEDDRCCVSALRPCAASLWLASPVGDANSWRTYERCCTRFRFPPVMAAAQGFSNCSAHLPSLLLQLFPLALAPPFLFPPDFLTVVVVVPSACPVQASLFIGLLLIFLCLWFCGGLGLDSSVAFLFFGKSESGRLLLESQVSRGVVVVEMLVAF